MPYRESDPLTARAIGDDCGHDAASNRDRLGGAYKSLHSHVPSALDAFAALNVALQDEFSGRLKSICLGAGLSESQYRHFDDGLNGQGYPAVMLAILMDAAPARFIRACGRMFAAHGYEIRQLPERVPVETPEAILAELKRVRESADKMEAFVRHAGRTTR